MKDYRPLFKMLNELEVTIFEAPVSVKGTASIMLDKTSYEKLQRQMTKLNNKTNGNKSDK